MKATMKTPSGSPGLTGKGPQLPHHRTRITASGLRAYRPRPPRRDARLDLRPRRAAPRATRPCCLRHLGAGGCAPRTGLPASDRSPAGSGACARLHPRRVARRGGLRRAWRRASGHRRFPARFPPYPSPAPLLERYRHGGNLLAAGAAQGNPRPRRPRQGAALHG